MKKTVFSEKAPKPIGPYNQAVKAGKFLFVSGQLAIDPKEGKIVAKDVRATVGIELKANALLRFQLLPTKTNLHQSFLINYKNLTNA